MFLFSLRCVDRLKPRSFELVSEPILTIISLSTQQRSQKYCLVHTTTTLNKKKCFTSLSFSQCIDYNENQKYLSSRRTYNVRDYDVT
ncbi:hypothetical protein OAV88_03720 [bacterium]|nr:hypothetical protein [bacterium]